MLLTAMLSLFAIYSCEEKPGPTEPAALTLNPSEEIVFDAKGGTETVKVTSNREWSVESDQPDYFAVQRTTDTTFTVTAELMRMRRLFLQQSSQSQPERAMTP